VTIASDEVPELAPTLAAAEAREAEGDLLAAARALESVPPARRDPLVDVRAVDLRHRAFAAAQADARPADPPGPPPEDRWPGLVEPPEVDLRDLDRDVLRSAVHHHGCLIVRGLLPPRTCDQLRSDIDDAFAAFDRRVPAQPVEQGAPWFANLEIQPPFAQPDPVGTAFLRKGGGVYAPCAPRAFLDYRQALEDAGLLAVVADYLASVPVLSLEKTVLRRISGGAEPSWHQDGGYLGTDRDAVNLWTALTDCGGDTDAMGMDMVPGPKRELAQIGTHDAVDERAIAQHVAAELAKETGRPIQRPRFRPGDGILFDQFFVHRSDIRPLTRERYAIESWFFTARDFPPHLVPVVAG
jgi:hypothetical protein